MKKLLVTLLAISVIGAADIYAFAEKGTHVDTVRFIQYLDENTALEEVRNGNLDMYYYSIPADRLGDAGSREGLKVYDSTGGSYSILVNPAESEKFNPFSIKEVRFALNYLIDRKLIVNELMGGFGTPSVSYYGQNDPEYLTIIEQVESFNFRYNPKVADAMITEALQQRGAAKTDGRWTYEGKPVEITIFIRSDDPVRKSIGEILSSELQDMGFVVSKDFGDLNKAFVVVYGSDPADMKWSLYTEGWGRSSFVRYDSVGLGQMYSPWFSSMPGFNDPNYWNYENEELDYITQRIYAGEFKSEEERAGLIQDAVGLGIGEAVRIFLASRTDRYVVNENVSGVVNDFGAGVPSRFTPINSRNDSDEMVIGVKQIYQGAWNPVMGLSDSYSRHIWGVVSDPATFKHPFTGETFPVRSSWQVSTAGQGEKMKIPEDAVMWDVKSQSWRQVPDDSVATSMVVFDFEFGNWHHGRPMNMEDVLHSLYFTVEWGTRTGQDDRTFDTEFTPRAAQIIDTLVGVRQTDDDTVEVYVDYWHFDEGEIASWASLWGAVPWEITAAMEQAVLDGKASFSRSGATSKNINWLSLLVPKDAHTLRQYLEEFKSERYIPTSTGYDMKDWHAIEERYDSAIEWIDKYDHAVISNGPFHLDSYSPESRTITVRAFADDAYPFEAGFWSDFEETMEPTIRDVDIPKTIQIGSETKITVDTYNADMVLYFLRAGGELKQSGTVHVKDNTASIIISGDETGRLGEGAGSVKIFAVSKDVLRPDSYTVGFLALNNHKDLPETIIGQEEYTDDIDMWWFWPVVLAAAVIIAAAIIARRKKARMKGRIA